MIKQTIGSFVGVNLLKNLKAITGNVNQLRDSPANFVYGRRLSRFICRASLQSVETGTFVDRTMKQSEMEVDCDNFQAKYSHYEPQEEAIDLRAHPADTYSAKNKPCSSDLGYAKTSACHTDLAGIAGSSENAESLSGSGSFGLVSLFDESVVLERGKRKEKRKQSESSEQYRRQDWQREKRKKTRPNYFVAWKVSNPEIHSAIKVVQDSILTHNEILKPAVIPLETLHITLLVMHLEDNEQVEKAKTALENCKTGICSILGNAVEGKVAECTAENPMEMQEHFGEDSTPGTASQESVPVALTFSGLDHFGHQVLFAKVGSQEDITLLKSVASVVRETFTSEGIFSSDGRDFQPHLTVMKLSRKPLLKKKGIKAIPPESYSAFQDMDFGRQPVTQLQLCSMIHPKENGFYKIFGTVELGDNA